MLNFTSRTKRFNKPEKDLPKGLFNRICFYILPERISKHIRYWLAPAVILSAYSLFYLNNPVSSLAKLNEQMSLTNLYFSYAALILVYAFVCYSSRLFSAKAAVLLSIAAKVLIFLALLTFIVPTMTAVKNYMAIKNEISDIQIIGDSVIEYYCNNRYFPTSQMLIESSFIFRIYALQYNENLLNCKLEHLSDNTVIIASAFQADKEHIAKQVDEYGFCFVYIAAGEVVVVSENNLDMLDFTCRDMSEFQDVILVQL